MQFGKVLHPEKINFFLPKDHPHTQKTLTRSPKNNFDLHIGCAKWNRQDLKGFYPRGIKDELSYYSNQFNSVELNATFYNLFPKTQFEKWNLKTNEDFKFFPKLTRDISHDHQLNDTAIHFSKFYIENVQGLQNKLGCVFLQLHEEYSPENYHNLEKYIINWPKDIPLAVELRHTKWFNDLTISDRLYNLFSTYGITNIITDTAGRRDLLHMSLTTPKAFIRFVGANHETDYTRLDEWVIRLKTWKNQGIEEINFFIHQNVEIESVKLSVYFIEKLNQELGLNHPIPKTLDDNQQLSLF